MIKSNEEKTYYLGESGTIYDEAFKGKVPEKFEEKTWDEIKVILDESNQ